MSRRGEGGAFSANHNLRCPVDCGSAIFGTFSNLGRTFIASLGELPHHQTYGQAMASTQAVFGRVCDAYVRHKRLLLNLCPLGEGLAGSVQCARSVRPPKNFRRALNTPEPLGISGRCSPALPGQPDKDHFLSLTHSLSSSHPSTANISSEAGCIKIVRRHTPTHAAYLW